MLCRVTFLAVDYTTSNGVMVPSFTWNDSSERTAGCCCWGSTYALRCVRIY